MPEEITQKDCERFATGWVIMIVICILLIIPSMGLSIIPLVICVIAMNQAKDDAKKLAAAPPCQPSRQSVKSVPKVASVDFGCYDYSPPAKKPAKEPSAIIIKGGRKGKHKRHQQQALPEGPVKVEMPDGTFVEVETEKPAVVKSKWKG